MFSADRVLFVHAHPDDETLSTGLAIAKLTTSGRHVGVLTLTMGEAGEVRPEAAAEVARRGLTAVRADELAAALDALGAECVVPARRFADSGMAWGPDGRATHAEHVSNEALSKRPLREVVDVIVDAIETFVPTAVVTYDADGGYGHPDHQTAHAATLRAVAQYRIPLYVVDPKSLDAFAYPDDTGVPLVLKALRSYKSQLRLDGIEIVHVGGQVQPAVQAETFRRAHVPPHLGKFSVALVALFGVAIGVAGSFSHQSSPPFGVLLSLLAALGLIVGMRVLGSIPGTIAAGLGVTVATALLAIDPFGEGPELTTEGLVPLNAFGWIWLIVPVVTLIAVLAWPRLSRRLSSRAAALEARSQA